MNWAWNEDVIVCKYYFNNMFDLLNKEKLKNLMIELWQAGYSHDINSVRMRIANYKFIDMGVGLSHPSEQSKAVYAYLYKTHYSASAKNSEKGPTEQNDEKSIKNREMENYYKTKVYVNSIVEHKKFGVGTVEDIDNGYVYILFKNYKEPKCFRFPRAFVDDILVLEQ